MTDENEESAELEKTQPHDVLADEQTDPPDDPDATLEDDEMGPADEDLKAALEASENEDDAEGDG